MAWGASLRRPAASARRHASLGAGARATPAARAAIAAVLVAHCCVREAGAFVQEVYTTNAICKKRNCINPVFPGVEDLHRLSASAWTCSSLRSAAPSMDFCRAAVNYDPALPQPFDSTGAYTSTLVMRQDNAAATMFVYHLAGMGIDAWEYQKPELSNDDCIKSIWRMLCYTYFPRARVGCQEGESTQYLRPCQSCCANYVRACGVECCDESVQCVFTHTKALNPSTMIRTEGYSSHDGPSSLCTGAARRSAGSPPGVAALLGLLLLAQGFLGITGAASPPPTAPPPATGPWRPRPWLGCALLALLAAATMQGCDYDVPVHTVGNWRGEPDYLITYEFVPPGASARDAQINSCSLERLALTMQCSGRGVCREWDDTNVNNRIAFCQCHRNWADPECGTRRKSQVVAYLLSLFFGYLGADLFYLGFMNAGVLKLLTLGGFGIWWIVDIVRIGSAPVYAARFRVAGDLPHWAFTLTTVMLAVLLGFGIAHASTTAFRARRRKEALLLQMEEEARSAGEMPSYEAGPGPLVGPMGRPMKPKVVHGYPGLGGPPYGSMGTESGTVGAMRTSFPGQHATQRLGGGAPPAADDAPAAAAYRAD